MIRAEFERVSYAQKSTPKNLREYRIVSWEGVTVPAKYGAVGTRAEIYKWAKEHNIQKSQIKIME
jgi:hypothetical protein